MVKEGPELRKKDFQTMNYEQLQSDPVAGPILQKHALEYLRTKDRKWFDSEFTGAMEPGGYLISKVAGHANVKPSQTIGDAGLQEVMENTRKELGGGLKEKKFNAPSSELSQESIKNMQLTQAIIKVKSFKELAEVFEKSGGLQGTQKLYSPKELRELINRVSAGESPMLLTGEFGFRGKVLELIQIEKLRRKLSQ